VKGHQPGGRRSYERFCPLSLALDQIGERWTLHIILALMSGPKRYTQLKTFLAGSGQNILSERLHTLAANGIVARSAGDSPGSDITYHLTARGEQLRPVVGGLATWGLSLMLPTQGGEDTACHDVFDLSWTSEEALDDRAERYQWTIDGVTFTLAVRGCHLTRTPGRANRPHATFVASTATLSEIVRGQISVADAIDHGLVKAKGSPEAIRRMFVSLGFPLAQVRL
jgi:DNA-binding HxlR family transcriptional regulator